MSGSSTGTAPTDLGKKHRKLFDGQHPIASRIDTTDPDQVFDLACDLVDASDRRLMQVSLPELRALAQFAATSGMIASQVGEVVALSDKNAPRKVMSEALDRLCAIARPFMVTK